MASRFIKQHIIRGLPTPPIPSKPSSRKPALKLSNPFIPHQSPNTGKWTPPKYSLRQQAEIIKKARQSGTLELLPPSNKTSSARTHAIAFTKSVPVVMKEENTDVPVKRPQPVEWIGKYKEKVVVGAETGNRLYAGKKRMFKGHKWEREARRRKKWRRILMRDMAKRVRSFKEYYKRRRPSPLGPAKSAGGKLPF